MFCVLLPRTSSPSSPASLIDRFRRFAQPLSSWLTQQSRLWEEKQLGRYCPAPSHAPHMVTGQRLHPRWGLTEGAQVKPYGELGQSWNVIAHFTCVRCGPVFSQEQLLFFPSMFSLPKILEMKVIWLVKKKKSQYVRSCRRRPDVVTQLF